MTRVAYFDLVGGAAGDMLTAALVDAGCPVDGLRSGLAGLAVEPFELVVSRRRQTWLDACHVDVRVQPGHDAPHRHLDDVVAILERADLPPRALARARRAFELLAEAEGKVHGVPASEVHFHEVGALDAIVDVAAVCLALELLGVDRVECSPLPLGRGQVKAEHGLLPLPAPAVLRLVEARGAMVEGRETTRELVTPTGAALLCALAERFGPLPPLTVERVGYGSGTRVAGPTELPNVTRVVLGQTGASAAPNDVVVLEANIDNATPEHVAYLAERLLAAGALDVFCTGVTMKKGRPGVVVTTLAAPATAGPLEDVLFAESPTLGVRRRLEARTTLAREVVSVTTEHGAVRVKLASRPDGRVTAAPEHEDVARLARERGRPLREVYEAALRAAEDHMAKKKTKKADDAKAPAKKLKVKAPAPHPHTHSHGGHTHTHAHDDEGDAKTLHERHHHAPHGGQHDSKGGDDHEVGEAKP